MRPVEPDDVKYAFAAWRMAAFDFKDFDPDGDTPEVFTAALSEYVAARYQAAFTLIANAPSKGVIPVGIVFGITPFLGKKVIWCGDFMWFPWASKRNKLECAVHFFNQMRKEWVILGFCENMAELPFFEHICRYGVGRRVGTIFDMITEGPTALFQSRKPYKA